MDVLFIESIYLIAASGKLFHSHKKLENLGSFPLYWVISFAVEKVGAEVTYKSGLTVAPTPLYALWYTRGTKGASSFLTCVDQLSVTHFLWSMFFLAHNTWALSVTGHSYATLIAMENLLMCAFKLCSWKYRANLDTNNLPNPPSLVITLCLLLVFWTAELDRALLQ